MSLPISTSYSDIMRCRQAWWGVSGTLNCVLFFIFLCFHPQPWKYGILSSNRAQTLLYLTLSNLLNFIVFVCSSEKKRDNADASIEWRLISFWSAEINRWNALSGNFFFFKRDLSMWVNKRELTELNCSHSAVAKSGGRNNIASLKEPQILPPNSNGENCFFVSLEG